VITTYDVIALEQRSRKNGHASFVRKTKTERLITKKPDQVRRGASEAIAPGIRPSEKCARWRARLGIGRTSTTHLSLVERAMPAACAQRNWSAL
jgi:hypothetical protein